LASKSWKIGIGGQSNISNWPNIGKKILNIGIGIGFQNTVIILVSLYYTVYILNKPETQERNQDFAKGRA